MPEFRRSLRGYDPKEVERFAGEAEAEVQQLRNELAAARARAAAMQVEIEELHGRLAELRDTEGSLTDSLDELRRRREELESDSEQRAREVLVEAERRADLLTRDSVQQVAELRRQVEQLTGMRAGLTQGLQRLSDDISGALARVSPAPPPADGGSADAER